MSARLESVDPIRYQALSFVVDVLASPGACATAASTVMERFQVSPPRRSRQLLPVETVPLWGMLDLSAADYPRFVLYVDGILRLEGVCVEQAVDLLSWTLNAHVAAAAREYYLLHAACLAVPGTSSALLLSAPSGAGKSTLSGALVQRGFGYLSDEFAPIDPVSGQVHAYPKPINVKAGSVAFFPGVAANDSTPESTHWHVTPESLGGTTVTAPRDVRFIIFPRWRKGSDLVVSPMSRGEAVLALAEQSLSGAFYGPRAVDVLARLVGQVELVRLEYGSTADAVAAIGELVGRTDLVEPAAQINTA